MIDAAERTLDLEYFIFRKDETGQLLTDAVLRAADRGVRMRVLLDYRVHNKLLVVDNSIALVGGRNIGDRYFQVDPDTQFGDDDVIAAGPIVRSLSASFDKYWNSPLAIPLAAIKPGQVTRGPRATYRRELEAHRRELKSDGTDYASRVAAGEPLAGVLSGSLPLVWARAQAVYDAPQKKLVEDGDQDGRLMRRSVSAAAAAVKSELLMCP